MTEVKIVQTIRYQRKPGGRIHTARVRKLVDGGVDVFDSYRGMVLLRFSQILPPKPRSYRMEADGE